MVSLLFKVTSLQIFNEWDTHVLYARHRTKKISFVKFKSNMDKEVEVCKGGGVIVAHSCIQLVVGAFEQGKLFQEETNPFKEPLQS